MQKIYENRFFPVILVLGHLTLFGIVIYIMDYFPRGEINEILKKWVPWNLRVNFLLLLVGIFLSHQDILGSIKNFLNKKGTYLLLLLLLSFSLVFFVAPRTHRIFFDEDIYANTGQNIALTNQTGYANYGTFEYGEYHPQWITYNKDPSGWPFLISLVFQLFGTNEAYAFFLNNLLFIGSVLLVFFITWSLTGCYFTSSLSALIFGLVPHNLTWANTAAAEPSASFFAGAVVLSLIVFAKTRNNRHLFLLAVMIPFASYMRPETTLVFFLVVVAFLVLSPRDLVSKKFWGFGLLTALFLLPNLLHFYALGGHSWGAEGAKFSFGFFWENLRVNGLYYLNNESFPTLFTLLFLVGLVLARHALKWKLLTLTWFLLFWGIFLFFYAGSYRYGADVRFSLLSFMPLSILAGMGGAYLREKIEGLISKDTSFFVILVLLFAFVRFLPLVRQVGQEAWGARYDHKYAREFIKKIPERSIVLTHNPTMFLLWKQNAIQTYAGINNPDLIKRLMKKYYGHVYFHYDYWCNTKSERNQRLCREIKEKYRLEEIVSAQEQDYKYALFKMSTKVSRE